MKNFKNKFFNISQRAKYKTFILTLSKWLFWGSLIGVFSGITSAILLNTNDFLTDTREKHSFLIFFLPLGGIVIGYIYRYHGRNSRKGNDLIIEHIHYSQGEIPLRMGPIVFICTFITHLFGGSTGREGAAIQMGASIAESVNRIFKVDRVDRRILIISGIAGGFGSAFGTPLAGTFFAMEVISLGKMKYEAIIPAFTASFVGHLVTSGIGVEHEHHVIKSLPNLDGSTIIKVILASIIFGVVSLIYSQIRHGIKRFSDNHLKNLMVRAALGGAVIIALTFIVGTRDYLGRGLPIVDQAFKGPVSPFAFFWKIIFTAITMGTGFRGGEVIPLFFIGATLGNTLSGLLNLPTSFLVAIGMIAVFCGASNAPLACFVFAMESFNGDAMIFFFIACLVSYIASGNHGIYAAQKIFEPKSRLFDLPNGKTIKSVEKDKDKKV